MRAIRIIRPKRKKGNFRIICPPRNPNGEECALSLTGMNQTGTVPPTFSTYHSLSRQQGARNTEDNRPHGFIFGSGLLRLRDDQNKGRPGQTRDSETPVEACSGERTYHESEPYPAASGFSQTQRKLYKCIKKAVKQKQIRRRVKEVQKFINKSEKGIMVLAKDTLPIEVYCHLPVMCEDQNMSYVYIPSKTDLGAAAGSKRPTCVIMVKPHEEYQEAYDECLEEVQALPPPL
ncbi:Hypothetical predicted protein [Marmota monax]|uniref:H/ACA ribonucleoprotein complex subunit 2 n=1 Tax=Marmota monax TaxID=9995 RepID=A0A5E4BT63_MARMO|nr:Hypothetical predicted protein [Marmota monax]